MSQTDMIRPQPRLSGALSASAALHAGAAAGILLLIAGTSPPQTDLGQNRTRLASVFTLPRPGPEGGRTPGGDSAEPARRLLRTGRDRLSVPPAETAPVASAQPAPSRVEVVAIAAEPLASALRDLPGTVVAASFTGATGIGNARDGMGDGAGPGGLGSGDGPRSGLGDGPGGYGSGALPPRLILQVRPNYTAEAMRARLQGIVGLEATVLPNGTVGDIRIVRSLDRTFGLDAEAIKAVRQWRFAPGTRGGRPTPMTVSIELSFTLR